MKHHKNLYIKTAAQMSTQEESTYIQSEETSNVSEVKLPKTATAFHFLMSANLFSALINNISDCDETYNYWEPLHHLIYGKGFETWEYSPVYAIRSWAYIHVHYVFTLVFLGFAQFEKLIIFYFIRMVLGAFCTVCQLQFYEGVVLRFGNNVAKILLVVMVCAPGMFISSTAFLPSSFCMYMTYLCLGTWLKGNLSQAILAIACGAILGWPFCVVIGIPLAIDIFIRRQKYMFFIKWCVIALLTMLVPCFAIDSFYYGKPVVACLNILWYNVFSKHGPDLYGTEPASYYLLNGILNFNVAFITGICAIIIIPCLECSIAIRYRGYRSPVLLLLFTLSPMYIWFLIFFLQPHKEERFLFPIYPCICLSAAVTVGTIQKAFCAFQLNKYINVIWISRVFLFGYIMLSLSRIAAVVQGYQASMHIYLNLKNIEISDLKMCNTKIVCAGKEWHRFPSSFFLPENFTLQFIESDFHGQLPQLFDGQGTQGTRAVLPNFNQENLEQKDRYVDMDRCHFLIDFDSGETSQNEPQFSKMESWEVLKELDYIYSNGSKSRLYRSFYIPFYYNVKNTFGKYQLLRRSTHWSCM
ncbi:unnamed protein product [Clavelina lepadiformis]|uniref:Mannosyltransferase n=1 Tax=Clavelina lepadiformis TaxID=159417 RepID=A0ABP0GDR2_CLALP